MNGIHHSDRSETCDGIHPLDLGKIIAGDFTANARSRRD